MRILRNTDSSKLFTVGPCLERKCNFWNVCLGLTICQGVRRWRGRWHPEIECQEWSDRKGLTAQSATRGHFLKHQRCSICEEWIVKGVWLNFFSEICIKRREVMTTWPLSPLTTFHVNWNERFYSERWIHRLSECLPDVVNKINI